MYDVILPPDPQHPTAYVGEELGKKMYKCYLKRYLPNSVINVYFPKNVEKVSISFVHGFTNEAIEQFGMALFCERVLLHGNDKVVEKFIKCMG